ncbi:hypothetical protein BU25DRAFT_88550 [Macroventuria anomochaeta]|uniref:Uncharacterized protein n=1 Tax=Macroventuria anomochaeta TaxID=301207 RepID=A0ACB6SGG6_9PLEO|nr:uncharacterized protein BU25DRAFT_88550 [Macroventuria anomochaeta]KAF2633073.1 hypothetical protein BU25DRAFT_88550 [Macroventuria anomochaeta]
MDRSQATLPPAQWSTPASEDSNFPPPRQPTETQLPIFGSATTTGTPSSEGSLPPPRFPASAPTSAFETPNDPPMSEARRNYIIDRVITQLRQPAPADRAFTQLGQPTQRQPSVFESTISYLSTPASDKWPMMRSYNNGILNYAGKLYNVLERVGMRQCAELAYICENFALLCQNGYIQGMNAGGFNQLQVRVEH